MAIAIALTTAGTAATAERDGGAGKARGPGTEPGGGDPGTGDPSAPPSAGISASAPRDMHVSNVSLRGVPVTIFNRAAGVTDGATLVAVPVRGVSRRPVVVARLVRTQAPRGRVILWLKPTRAGMSTIRRLGVNRLTIRVRVTGPGLAPSDFTRTMTLRR